MLNSEELRSHLRINLDSTIDHVNRALRGQNISELAPVLTRLGRGGQLPHWFDDLESKNTLPNLDGKTVGSVVEMILVAVLETYTFKSLAIPPLRINPARGVDIPELDLGIKSPSLNFCTSEPFFSAYERLYGSNHDALVLRTDYQEAKKIAPFKLQIVEARYLAKSEIADRNLCRIARRHRAWLLKENEAWAKRVFRFLAYVNQSDWMAKVLVSLVADMADKDKVQQHIKAAQGSFNVTNKRREKKDQLPLPDTALEFVNRIGAVVPVHLGIIDALDSWVISTWQDAARAPNENEWERLVHSPSL